MSTKKETPIPVKHTFKLFGDRIALKPLEQKTVGRIALPANTRFYNDMGEVVACGDGVVTNTRTLEKTNVPITSKIGEIALFQLNQNALYNSSQMLKGQKYIFLIQDDIFATLKSAIIRMEDFAIAGNWLLLDAIEEKTEKSLIITPDSVKSTSKDLRYIVKQAGSLVTKVKVGDSVVIERSRANPISIGENHLFYIHQMYCHGLIEESLVLA